MKAKVNSFCIGCGACQALVPEVFEINDEGVAEVIVESVPEDLIKETEDARDNCPVAAISINENNGEK